MLECSANNQTFHRSKLEYLNWLGLEFLKITFSVQEDDPLVDIEEIRELLDEESSNE